MKQIKLYPIGLILILVLLIINFISTIYEYVDYQRRVKNGDIRWKQVEERINQIKEECGCGTNS